MKLNKLYIALLLIIPILSCSSDNSEPQHKQEPSLEAKAELNIAYGEHPQQTFDLYLPHNRTADTKVLVLIHGGGWTSGDKKDMDFIKDLIKNNMEDKAIVNLNYRLADAQHSPFPMQIEDIEKALRFIKNHRDDYVVSNDIGLIGISAGGHLALLYGYAFDMADQIKMVCSIVGPTNFTDPAYLNNQHPQFNNYTKLYGIDPSDITFLENISPYHNATETSPPTILFYGDEDPLIPSTQGIMMRDRLDALGVENEFTLYQGQGHGWTGLELVDTWSKLKNFITAHLN